MAPSALDLRAKAAALRQAADEQLASISEMKSLTTALGDEVAMHGEKKGLKKGYSSRDLFESWDRNGNSHLSKMEFRVAARKLNLAGADDSKAVDSLFARLDQDGDGNLNTSESEFKGAVKMLKGESVAARVSRSEAHVEAERKQAKATQCDAAAAAAEAAEEAKAELARFDQLVGASVQRRVGLALLRNHFKPTDIVLKWDTNFDGQVDKAEMVAGLQTLGVQASAQEVGEMFDAIDRDGSGFIDLAEARKAFHAFHMDKAAYEARRVELKKALEEARKVAKAERHAIEQLEAAEAAALKEAKTAAKAAAKPPGTKSTFSFRKKKAGAGTATASGGGKAAGLPPSVTVLATAASKLEC